MKGEGDCQKAVTSDGALTMKMSRVVCDCVLFCVSNTWCVGSVDTTCKACELIRSISAVLSAELLSKLALKSPVMIQILYLGKRMAKS